MCVCVRVCVCVSVHTFHIFFIHSSMRWTLGLLPCLGYCEEYCCKHGGACIPSEFVLLYSLGSYALVRLLERRVVLFLPFRGTSVLFCTVAAFPACVPTNSAGVFLFLHVLANTCCFLVLLTFSWAFLDSVHPLRVRVKAACLSPRLVLLGRRLPSPEASWLSGPGIGPEGSQVPQGSRTC